MQFPAILEQKKKQLIQKKKMPRRRITRTPTKKMGTMALRDTNLLLLQCSISMHPTPLETLAFLQLMMFSLRWIHKVLCKYLQISGSPEFLNNRT
ncbi:unnamed protein product [Brassica napus]|uniref:(rape) hypothetical protein n=1 Tax=Brassica napus TaxID=3708 RepID=A0A816RLS6_BRANA|nr:unnamed protein product [Brassica napus]